MKFIASITKNKVLSKIGGSIFLLLRLFYQEMKSNEFRRKYDIDPSFRFNGPGTIFYGEGSIKIGEGSYIGRYSTIATTEGAKVTIGKNCSLSHYVMMYTGNRVANQDFSVKPHKNESGDIEIGDDCWIGAFAFIKHGVKIGKNCVIGAHSVVTKDIPDYSIAVGSPAKVVKKIDRA